MHRKCLVFVLVLAGCSSDPVVYHQPRDLAPETPAAAPRPAAGVLTAGDFAEWTRGVNGNAAAPLVWEYFPNENSGLMIMVEGPATLSPPAPDRVVVRFQMSWNVATAAEIAPTVRLLLSYVHGVAPELDASIEPAHHLPRNLGPLPIEELRWRVPATGLAGWVYAVMVEAELSEGTRTIPLKDFRISVSGHVVAP